MKDQKAENLLNLALSAPEEAVSYTHLQACKNTETYNLEELC